MKSNRTRGRTRRRLSRRNIKLPPWSGPSALSHDLTTAEYNRTIASDVISLGQRLNLKVIAEGVETEEQMAFLRESNCDEIRGYHLSQPLEAHEFDILRKPPAWLYRWTRKLKAEAGVKTIPDNSDRRQITNSYCLLF